MCGSQSRRQRRDPRVQDEVEGWGESKLAFYTFNHILCSNSCETNVFENCCGSSLCLNVFNSVLMQRLVKKIAWSLYQISHKWEETWRRCFLQNLKTTLIFPVPGNVNTDFLTNLKLVKGAGWLSNTFFSKTEKKHLFVASRSLGDPVECKNLLFS